VSLAHPITAVKETQIIEGIFTVLEWHGNNTLLSHGYLGKGGRSINNHRVTIG